MADNLTQKQRSYCMSRIKSKWTSPELKIHNYLKGKKIKHKMHPDLPGRPDILLTNTNTVVFLHGCFWHKCPKCYKEPKSRKEYWIPKIEKNVKNYEKNAKILKINGYKVVKIWGHDVKNGRCNAFFRFK
jgi:DNA mismatch endonuclease (patch repair protein)